MNTKELKPILISLIDKDEWQRIHELDVTWWSKQSGLKYPNLGSNMTQFLTSINDKWIRVAKKRNYDNSISRTFALWDCELLTITVVTKDDKVVSSIVNYDAEEMYSFYIKNYPRK